MESADQSPLSLVLTETEPNCTAWRATETDAPGLFALISSNHGTSIPVTPDTDDMTIAIFDEGVDETLGSIEVSGRAGLNRWYMLNVGHEPDSGPDGLLPILELIDNVASHLLLRYF